MWSDLDWSLLHVSSRKIFEALTRADLKPIEIANRKPVFDKPVDWLKVEQIVERLISGGVEPDNIKIKVESLSEDVEVQAPPASKQKTKGGKRGRRPSKK